MSKREGIYLSVDYRVTDLRTGKLLDDAAPKLLSVSYAPYEGGPTALFAYTGLALLPDGTPTGDWLRETLRGESEEINDSMLHLKRRLDRDFARHRQPLVVTALLLHGKQRFIAGLSNLRQRKGSEIEIDNSFGYIVKELNQPWAFANGSGAEEVQTGAHLDLLRSQLGVKPRRTLDHMKLLATVNRRVAANISSVSPFCQVSFINADDTTEPISTLFLEGNEEVPFALPVVLFGIDISGIARRGHERAMARTTTENTVRKTDPGEIEIETLRRP